MMPILQDILRYHILLSSVLYSGLIPMGTTTITVANNSTLTIVKTATSLTVNGATVTMPDMLASNGVIHGISLLLLKPGQYDFSLLRALNAVNATVFLNTIDTAGMGSWFVTQVSRLMFVSGG